MSLDMLSPRLLSSYALGALAAVPPEAPPELRTALEGVIDDDLPRGTHLRLLPSATLGLPLAPWLLWRLDALRTADGEGVAARFAWRGARAVDDDTVVPDGGSAEITGYFVGPLPRELRLVAVEVTEGDVARLALLTSETQRVAAVRTRPPFCVTGPEIRLLRVRASGPFRLHGWMVHDEKLRALAARPPDARLGAPAVHGPWYAGDPSLEDPWERVRRGAPRRKTPVDQPAGAPVAWPDPAAAEDARVRCFADSLIETFRYMAVKDPALPADQRYAPPEAEGRATLNPTRALLLQALDPGAARLLGLMTWLPPNDLYETVDPRRRSCWVAGGLFLRPPADTAQRDDDWFVHRSLELTPPVRDLLVELRTRSLQARAYLALAFVAPPPDRPEVPKIALDAATWRRDGIHPGNAFRQGFRLPEPPVAVLAALARREATKWQPRSAMMQPANRRAPLLLGMPKPDAPPLPPQPHYARVYDDEVPGDGAPWRYRIALGDLFGRFGPAREVQVPAPARPAVPRPVIETRTRARVTRPPGTVAASPGTLEVVVNVPAHDDLPAGSRALRTVYVEGVPGVARTERPASAGRLSLSFALPECLPEQRKAFDIRAWFEDDLGREGEAATAHVVAVDPRPPAVPETAAGLLWTSRPGPATEVELGVRLPARPGSRWRVYITDLNALAAGTPMPGSRAEAADKGRRLTTAARDKFRLLTAQPLEVAGTELAFDTTLPRALQTVQFLRFVPLNEHGVEAEFTRCPLLPVAVPSDRRPPAPRIAVATGTAGVELTVLAEGLDVWTLRSIEPGLFKATPDPSARAPEFRLRRASGAVAEPIYARELTVDAGGRHEPGVLAWNRSSERFEATIADRTAEPFVRYFYWAEVRMPAERRLRKGVAELPFPAGAIRPVDATQLQDAPGAFSDASPAASALVVPARIATLRPAQVTATVTDLGGSWRLDVQVADGPTVSPRSVAPYTVRVYVQADDDDLVHAGSVALVDGAAAITRTVATAVPSSARVGVVLVDPIGRHGRTTFVTADVP
jgi:hypothetical protein